MQAIQETILALETAIKLCEIGHISSKSGKAFYVAVGAATVLTLIEKTKFDLLGLVLSIDSIALLTIAYVAIYTYVPKKPSRLDLWVGKLLTQRWFSNLRILITAATILSLI